MKMFKIIFISSENSPIRSLKVFVTMKVHIQLKAVATDAAVPRIFPGKISPNMTLIKKYRRVKKRLKFSKIIVTHAMELVQNRVRIQQRTPRMRRVAAIRFLRYYYHYFCNRRNRQE